MLSSPHALAVWIAETQITPVYFEEWNKADQSLDIYTTYIPMSALHCHLVEAEGLLDFHFEALGVHRPSWVSMYILWDKWTGKNIVYKFSVQNIKYQEDYWLRRGTIIL